MSADKRERQHMNANRFHRGLPGRVKAVDDMKAQETGFTLIELLVVIASLAILAVTLLPGFAGTRQNSQVIGCLANQRQLAAAWMMYARDNQDDLVPNRGLDNEDPDLNQPDPRTDPLLQPGGQYSDWCPGNLQVSYLAARYPLWIQAGLLYPYLNNLNVYRCPADHSLVPEIGALVRASAFLAHLFDELLGGFDESANLRPRTLESWREYMVTKYLYKLSDMARPDPSKTWVFIEENPIY